MQSKKLFFFILTMQNHAMYHLLLLCKYDFIFEIFGNIHTNKTHIFWYFFK